MNYKKLIFYLLLLFFSNNTTNTTYLMDIILEYPKISSITIILFLGLFRNYLFGLACKYNCYNIVKLCHPHNWGGYKIINYDIEDYHTDTNPFQYAMSCKNKETITVLLTYPDVLKAIRSRYFLDAAAECDCEEAFNHCVRINNLSDDFMIYKFKLAKKRGDMLLVLKILQDNANSKDIITIANSFSLEWYDNIINVAMKKAEEKCSIYLDIITLLAKNEHISLFMRLRGAIVIEDFEIIEHIISDSHIKLPPMTDNEWALCVGSKSKTSKVAQLMIKYGKVTGSTIDYYWPRYLLRDFVDENFLKLAMPCVKDKTKILLQTLFYLLTKETKVSSSCIDFLIDHPDMHINEKVFDEGSRDIFHELVSSVTMFSVHQIEFMNRIQHINFHSCDKEGKTLFYYICNKIVNWKQLLFFSSLSEKSKKIFANCQLQRIAQKSNPEAYSVNNFSDRRFLQVCHEWGGNLNYRNEQGDRPVDTAKKIYLQVEELIGYPGCIPKINNYYYFLSRTPYISDGGLLIILMQKLNSDDITRKVMGYYTALTIDRHIIAAESSYSWYKSKHEKELIKKEILDAHCKKYRYLDPTIHHGNNTIGNRLAII